MNSPDVSGWWQPYVDILPPGFIHFLQHESQSTAVDVFSSMLIPGTLQTEDYARGILQSYEGILLSIKESGERLEPRMRWQQNIFNRHPVPDMHIILEESVLLRVFTNPQVHYEQLMHLTHLMQLPQVTIQVLPLDRGQLWIPRHILSFWLLRFDSIYPLMLSVEDTDEHVNSTNKVEVNQYRLSFEMISEAALDVDDSLVLIQAIAQKMHRMPNRHSKTVSRSED